MSTLQSNQIVSGQAADGTLQLNQQGGGRIDIPLPESSPTTISIEPIEINDTSSFTITRITTRAEFDASDPLNIKIALDDNTIVEFNNTVRMFSISDYNTLRDAFYLRWTEEEEIKEILSMTNLKNLADGDYYVMYISLLNENTIGYGGTMRFTVSDNNIINAKDSLYVGIRPDGSEAIQKFKTYFYLIGKE